jgi:hypothetical protein
MAQQNFHKQKIIALPDARGLRELGTILELGAEQ